jgi:hypothetical protein
MCDSIKRIFRSGRVLLLALALGCCAAAEGQVVISELMAADNAAIADENGAHGDWIEIHNLGEQPVNLTGWSLTDDAREPAKWIFPATNLTARGYWVLFASGQDRRVPGKPLHTNFKLRAEGEYLALFKPDGVTKTTEFAPYPRQYAGISFGLSGGSASAVYDYMSPATPGKANDVGYPALSAPVSFSLPGGVYGSNLVITLTSPESGATLRYTTNNTTPNETSALYQGPISLSASATIRARAYVSGRLPGETAAAIYTLLDSDALEFKSNLPLVILNTYGNAVLADMTDRVAATATIINTEANTGWATLLDTPDYHGQAGLEGRGATSWNVVKKPYNLTFLNNEGHDTAAAMLGLPAGADWALINLYSDKTLMNDCLAHELYEKMGRYAVRRRYVEVFMNGSHPDGADRSGKVGYDDYIGVYLLVEKIKIDEHRVNLAKLSESDTTEPGISGGYIFKKDKPSPNDLTFTTYSGQVLTFHDPKGQKLTALQRNWLGNYINKFETNFYGPQWLNPATGYTQYLDADSFVDYFWMVEFSKQFDGYRLSNYLSKDRLGKITAGPIWDWNLSFGNLDDAKAGSSQGWYYPMVTTQGFLWLSRLVNAPGDPDFIQQIADRWSVLRTNVFAVSNLLSRMDALTVYLHEAQAREFARWPRLGVYVWPNPPDLAAAVSHQAAVNYVKNWIKKRFAWVDSQFLIPPAMDRPSGLVQAGTPVRLSAPAGMIYYTLDGTDPRASGGQIASGAMPYSAPITVSNNVRIIARACLTNAWSGPATATYYAQIPALAITEIMYHPMAGGTNEADDFQYVELMNTGANTLGLAGFHFAQGIEFTFTAGELLPHQRILLVKNLAAFEARYGTNLNIAGVFTHSLAHGGERLVLAGPLDEPVFDLTYAATWASGTDGQGYSLVVNESADLRVWEEAAQWERSAACGGSPGQGEVLNVLSVACQSGSSVQVRFNAAANQAYRVQYCDSLTHSDWHTLAEVAAQSANHAVEISDSMSLSHSARYYRLQLQ